MAKKQSSTPRGLRDEANVGPDPRQARHLVPLKELGKFKVAADDPDIRGWAAFTSTGREVGRVDELLVDTTTNEVVMLDVDLRRDDRHSLVPLRAAWIDHAARRVVIDARELGDADLPSLSRRGQLSDDEVRRFDEGYGRAYGAYGDDRELRVRHADDELRFGRRAHDQQRSDRGQLSSQDLDRDGVDDRAERGAAAARRTDVRDANDRYADERHAATTHDRDRDGVDDRIERAPHAPAQTNLTQGSPVQRSPTQGSPMQGSPMQGSPMPGSPVQGSPAQADALRYRQSVERHPVDPDGYRIADAGERQIRVPRRTDEMVVESRPYVEEVVVRRRAADDPTATDRGTQDLDRGAQDFDRDPRR